MPTPGTAGPGTSGVLSSLQAAGRRLACTEGGQSDSDGHYQVGGSVGQEPNSEGASRKTKPKTKPSGRSDVLCPRQGPLKGELKMWASLPDGRME